MAVAVVVPWQPGCPHREAAWALVRGRYETLGWPIHVGVCEGDWSKGRAVADALRFIDADVLVIADADCLPPDSLPEAATVASEGQAWCVPHRRLLRLTEASTADVLAGGSRMRGKSSPSFPGGGVLVVRRDAYEASGGFDPRMRRAEDGQLAIVLRSMFGPCRRFDGQLVHLWHPPLYRVGEFGPAKPLMARWRKAQKDPAALARLIAEHQGVTL